MRRHRETVQFEFRHVLIGLRTQQLADTAIKRAQLVFVKRVIQAEHGRAVRNFYKSFAWLAADTLRRRIRRDELRMLRLQIPQSVHERVVFRVTDFGLVQNVVQVFVPAKRLPQVLNLVDEFGLHSIPL